MKIHAPIFTEKTIVEKQLIVNVSMDKPPSKKLILEARNYFGNRTSD